jgi:hypothetical protein
MLTRRCAGILPQPQGRTLLSKAKTSRNTDELRNALEATAAMGLGGMLEWIDAKRFLEGGAKEPRATKSGTNAKPDGKKETAYVDNSRHPRWKTELCTHWLMHGSCSYGKERCNFAHGEDDLRRPPDMMGDDSGDVVSSNVQSNVQSKGKEPYRAKEATSPGRPNKTPPSSAPSAAWTGQQSKSRTKVPPPAFVGGQPESPDLASVETVSGCVMHKSHAHGMPSGPFLCVVILLVIRSRSVRCSIRRTRTERNVPGTLKSFNSGHRIHSPNHLPHSTSHPTAIVDW